MGEAVRNPKHPFRKTDNQPKKALKNRYERRKIKEYLHLGGLAGGRNGISRFFDRLSRKSQPVSVQTGSAGKITAGIPGRFQKIPVCGSRL